MGDLFNPQSLNKYSYVMNNPVNMWDPIGNVPDWVKEQKTHLEFYETGGQIEYAYYFQKYDTGSNGLERIGEQVYDKKIEYYYEEQVYNNWLYSVVYCYNYREVEEEFGNIVWDWDTEETNKIYSETDYYYETITKYADEIANDVLQKIQQLVGNPPSNTGKPAFTIEKLNGEIINTEIAILGTKKNLSDSEITAVKVVQLKLNEVINAGLAVDGSYGPLTTGAAQYFQKVLKLPANGVMDTKTFTLLQYYYEYLTNEQISYVEREADRRTFEMVNKGMGETLEDLSKKNIADHAPPSISDWGTINSKLDPNAYIELADPAKYLRFENVEQILIDPVFAGRLAAYARDHGIIISITFNGGKRSYENQVDAYEKSGGKQDADGNWYGGDGSAAVPGTGWHELGFEVDVNKCRDDMPRLRELHANDMTAKKEKLIKYGLYKPMTLGNGWDGSTE